MNILLLCSAGMSTSLLVNRMYDAAKTKNIDLHIEAHPASQVLSYGDGADVILLAPQVRFELKNIKKKFPNKPVELIGMQEYGMMNGEKVIDLAVKLLNK